MLKLKKCRLKLFNKIFNQKNEITYLESAIILDKEMLCSNYKFILSEIVAFLSYGDFFMKTFDKNLFIATIREKINKKDLHL